MHQAARQPSSPAVADTISPPAWALDLAGEPQPWSGVEGPRGLEVEIRRATRDGLALVSARVPGAAALPAPEFQRLVTSLYAAVQRTVTATSAPAPVRMWNHIPAIHEDLGDGLDRYMAFNRARYAVFCGWFGGEVRFHDRVPTASAVGHRGSDLVVHCLSLRSAGIPVENPRQRPAYRYSPRYGPRPPCFARGGIVRLRGRPTLLVAGTASVRGEDTAHPFDPHAQLAETFENLSSLVCAASAGRAPADPLAAVNEARVYIARESDIEHVTEAVAARLGPACRLQTVRAEICRPDLLVEIEGVADLGDDR